MNKYIFLILNITKEKIVIFVRKGMGENWPLLKHHVGLSAFPRCIHFC